MLSRRIDGNHGFEHLKNMEAPGQQTGIALKLFFTKGE
jgi:hypothetical protein